MRPAAIRANVQDYAVLQALFTQIYPVVQALNLSKEVVRYYACYVERTQVFQVRQQAKTYPARLYVPHGSRLVAVLVAGIRWAEAAGDYCNLFANTGSCLSNSGITALQERLDLQLFLRVHHSALVALNAVRRQQRLLRHAGRR